MKAPRFGALAVRFDPLFFKFSLEFLVSKRIYHLLDLLKQSGDYERVLVIKEGPEKLNHWALPAAV